MNFLIGFFIAAAGRLDRHRRRQLHRAGPRGSRRASPPGKPSAPLSCLPGVLRLIAAPFYLFQKQIHVRYLWLLLKGAGPGTACGHLGAPVPES